MKKILITLLFLAVYCNSSFAKDFALVTSINAKTDPNFSYQKLAFLEKSKMNCEITTKASKENDFIQETACSSGGSNAACLKYIDKKIAKNYKPLPTETYCYSSFDLLAAR
jgi:hypothetical protein